MSTSQDPETAATSGPSSDSTDSHSLYTSISHPLIFGSNVGPPGSRDINKECRKCIKPWDQRLDTSQWTESLDAGEGTSGVSRVKQAQCFDTSHLTSGHSQTMIINIPFHVPVRVSSVLINQGVGESAPRRIRLYVNRPHGVDIDDVSLAPSSSSQPTHTTTGAPSSGLPQADFLLRSQDFNPSTSQERIQEYPLGRFAPRFASVNSISVVFSDCRASVQRVFYLNFRGTPPKPVEKNNDRIRVGTEDAASTPMGRVRDTARGAMSSITGAAADGTGGQAR